MSALTFPSKSTYCVNICPFSASCFISSSLAINLPSPCEIGVVNISPGFVFDIQGDLFDATLVRISFD